LYREKDGEEWGRKKMWAQVEDLTVWVKVTSFEPRWWCGPRGLN
jgi:hypothetical protein